MFYRYNFLIFQCQQGRAGESKEAGDEAEEGDGFEGEVCYSITHKVQFNVNCQIISYEGYLIKSLKFSEVQSERE